MFAKFEQKRCEIFVWQMLYQAGKLLINNVEPNEQRNSIEGKSADGEIYFQKYLHLGVTEPNFGGTFPNPSPRGLNKMDYFCQRTYPSILYIQYINKLRF